MSDVQIFNPLSRTMTRTAQQSVLPLHVFYKSLLYCLDLQSSQVTNSFSYNQSYDKVRIKKKKKKSAQ